MKNKAINRLVICSVVSVALLATATGCSGGGSTDKQPSAAPNPSKEPTAQTQQGKPVSTEPVVVVKDPPAIPKQEKTISVVSSKIEGGEIVVVVKSETDLDIPQASVVLMGLDKDGKDVKTISVDVKDVKPKETKEARIKNEDSKIVNLKEINVVAATLPAGATSTAPSNTK